MTVRFVLMLVLVAVLACKDSTAPRTLSGNWTGTATASASLFEFEVDLVDAGGTITGDGSVIGAALDCSPTITGTRSGSTVDLTFDCLGYLPFTFNASLSKEGQNLTGTLNGSGFNDNSLSLQRRD